MALTLEKDYQPLASAFCRPSNICPIPLVAVSSHLRGQPLLQIFDGETGSPVRWCEGHTERIRSLGFSEDGRMLLSVADDRTVAVWTVADLVDRVLKKRGRIPDLVVRHVQDQLVVSDPGSSTLRINDVILSVSNNGKAETPKTSQEFYRFILGCVPQDQVDIRFRRDGIEQVATCRVEQAIDEIKPLFSLFVVSSDRENDWEWIGWHPLGNFDFRGDRVERQLGWHFNTGDPLHPAAFAAAGEYRDKFVRPDLLQTLITKQKLELADLAPAAPQLKLSLRYKADDVVGDDRDPERLMIKSRDVLLVADVSGIANRRIRGLNVSIDAGTPVALNQDANREWIADLSNINWERGVHQLDVILATPEGDVKRTQSIQFQPRPPSIQWNQSWDKVIPSSAINVSAEITSTSEPIRVVLNVYPPGKAAQKVNSWDFNPAEKPHRITADVDLEAGESLLKLEAWNTGRDRPDEKLESEYKIVPITRANLPQAPRFSKVAVHAGKADARVPLVPTDQFVYRTSSPIVWITGLVQSENNIDGLDFTVGNVQQEMPGFRPGKQLQYSIDKQLTLSPGQKETITIRTKAGTSVDVRRLEIEYFPAMPSVTSLKIISGDALRPLPGHIQREPLEYFADYHDKHVTVKAILDGDFDQNCTGVFLVNGQPGESLTIHPGQAELTTNVVVADGPSIIELQVQALGASLKSQPVKITFKRPPVLGQPQAMAQVLSGQLFTLTCDAKSVIPLRDAFMTVGEQRRKVSFVQDQDHPGHWLLNFTGELNLPNGNHQLQIRATSDDGDCIEPAVHRVQIAQSTPPPVLELLGATSMVTDDSVVEFEFKVQSTLPADVKLEVRCDDGKVDQLKPPAAHSGDGRSRKASVQLAEGINTVTLSAYNQSGSSESRVLQISYVPPPMAVEIVAIGGQTPDFKTSWTADQKELRLRNKVLKSLVPVQGQVVAREPLTDKVPLYANIWVNCFKLPTVALRVDPQDPKKATFTSKVLLSQHEQNLIQVKIIGKEGPQPSEMGKTGTMLVDCESPDRNQALYLLLLGTGNAKQQEQQARKSLAVTSTIQPSVWRSDHFTEIHVMNAMNENVPHVQGRIALLERKMNSRLKAFPESGGNTIVLVLFQGQINVRPNQFHLQTDVFPANRVAELNEYLSGKLLESQMNKAYGAHLMLLDLQQQSIARESIWSKAPNLGILITNWNGLINRPEGSRLISDLRGEYPRLGELAASIENKSSSFPGQLETIDRLQSHYSLRFGSPK